MSREEYDFEFEEPEEYYEPQPYFTGCTCDHEQDQHGWGSCNVDDCPCTGGWEE